MSFVNFTTLVSNIRKLLTKFVEFANLLCNIY